jgi:hypothetical protein
VSRLSGSRGWGCSPSCSNSILYFNITCARHTLDFFPSLSSVISCSSKIEKGNSLHKGADGRFT